MAQRCCRCGGRLDENFRCSSCGIAHAVPSIAGDILTLVRCALFGAVWLFVGSLCGLSLIRMVAL